MMPEMSYIYEKTPEPITLDIYPDPTHASSCVMYDCRTVNSPIAQTTCGCVEDKNKIDVSISKSDIAYELCIHCDKEPILVAAGSKRLATLANKSDYNANDRGWYYGPECFYGSDQISTLNIKIPKSTKPHLVRIVK
jgi:hypothetical protein